MKSISPVTWLFLAMLLLVLAACAGRGVTGTPASDPNVVYTHIWETVAVGQTQTSAYVPPTQAATDTLSVTQTSRPTNTPLISPTPQPTDASGTAAPAVTATHAPAPQGSSCDKAEFVSDVTIADGTVVPAGQPFVKTWRIKNTGTCKWTEDYVLVFGWGGDGTNWKTAGSTHFSKAVNVGETIDVSIEIDAPTNAGTYGGFFATQNADGVSFGPTLTVVIKVQ
jgi:hypothetical protein